MLKRRHDREQNRDNDGIQPNLRDCRNHIDSALKQSEDHSEEAKKRKTESAENHKHAGADSLNRFELLSDNEDEVDDP